VRHGERLFQRLGCVSCHTPDWHLPAARPAAADYTQRSLGDRRLFDLVVAPGADGELRGRLRLLADRRGRRRLPRRGAVTIRGIYSDFRHHDLGAAFAQVQFDGSTIRWFRTTPLWGVGSTAPYGHDGASLTLEAVIRRHGGEASRAVGAYRRLSAHDRDDVLAFLNSLVLFSTEDLPTDIDHDGRIAEHFRVAGMDTGRERFNPEWLFNTPGRIEGPLLAPDGGRIVSQALTNLRAAYGSDLPWTRDGDGDGFPDILGGTPISADNRQ
jgi:Di-haem oxidoreductase, putative peroxidase